MIVTQRHSSQLTFIIFYFPLSLPSFFLFQLCIYLFFCSYLSTYTIFLSFPPPSFVFCFYLFLSLFLTNHCTTFFSFHFFLFPSIVEWRCGNVIKRSYFSLVEHESSKPNVINSNPIDYDSILVILR